MSIAYRFTAHLRFADRLAIEAAERFLRDEGFVGHEDNLISPGDLQWDELSLTVSLEGSMPASCFAFSWCVLAAYAQHACEGEATGLDFDDGYGHRMRAGAEDEEDLTPEEVDARAPPRER